MYPFDFFFSFCQCIFAISLLSPLKKGVVIHLNNFESFLSKDGPVVLEKGFFQWIFVTLHLKKERGLSFDQTWITFTQGCFISSLVEIGPVVLEKKMKI